MLSLAAFLILGCKGDESALTKEYLKGKWEIQKIPYHVTYTFNDSLFFIDAEYEGWGYNYQIKGNKLYYSECLDDISLKSAMDSMRIILNGDSLMYALWFNPSTKTTDIFELKKIN